MRKFLLLIITFCYLASTSGVALQWHYCMGKLRSIDFGLASHDETCGKCGMAKGNNHCCKDEVSVSKITDSHQQATQLAYSFVSFDAILPESFLLPEPIYKLIQLAGSNKAHAPPDISKDRTVLFQVFRC